MVAFTEEAVKQFGRERVEEDEGDLIISKEAIRFNGVGEDHHETFTLRINTGERELCKTNCKPYDALVVACLHYAKDINIILNWSSDGKSKDGDFDEGLGLYCHVLANRQRPAETAAYSVTGRSKLSSPNIQELPKRTKEGTAIKEAFKEDDKPELKLLELHSPDTIAECYDGVSNELCSHLWNVVLPSYEADELKLPQDGDAKFYRSLEPNGTGWLKYVDEKFKADLEAVAKAN